MCRLDESLHILSACTWLVILQLVQHEQARLAVEGMLAGHLRDALKPLQRRVRRLMRGGLLAVNRIHLWSSGHARVSTRQQQHLCC